MNAALNAVAFTGLALVLLAPSQSAQDARTDAQPPTVDIETANDATDLSADAGAPEEEDHDDGVADTADNDADVVGVVGGANAPDESVAHWTARATVTGYCVSGIMRSGRYTYVGAVATDRSVIPAGSLLYIEGLGGPYVSEDTGGGVRGWHIDVFMPSCRDAINWGRQTRAIRVDRWGY